MSKELLGIKLYQVKEGRADDLIQLIQDYILALQEHGFASNKEPYLAQTSDGVFLEVFEWLSDTDATSAKEHFAGFHNVKPPLWALF